jgi:hypothetical protein
LKQFLHKALTASLILLIGVLLSFCSDENSKVSNEGIIEYETKVVDENHPLAGLAPSSATLKFKQEKFLMEMSTMGMFNTMFLVDFHSKSLTQMVKFMDVKQASIETEKDIAAENSLYKLKIEETKDTKLIAGYKCHKLKVTMVDNPSVTFDAYYTKEMQVDNVNSLSPYAQVKGMLMQYRLKKMGLELQFTAKKVKNVPVPDNTFDVPAYFKIVSKEEMSKFFSGLQ